MNSAGTAEGTGRTNGDIAYLYGRTGVELPPTRADEIVLSGEVGASG